MQPSAVQLADEQCKAVFIEVFEGESIWARGRVVAEEVVEVWNLGHEKMSVDRKVLLVLAGVEINQRQWIRMLMCWGGGVHVVLHVDGSNEDSATKLISVRHEEVGGDLLDSSRGYHWARHATPQVATTCCTSIRWPGW